MTNGFVITPPSSAAGPSSSFASVQRLVPSYFVSALPARLLQRTLYGQLWAGVRGV
jgi:hypothetical protein